MSKLNQRTKCSALEWEDLLSLIEKLKAENNFRMLMLICSGSYMALRISDILTLKFSDLVGKSKIEIVERKTKKLRVITLHRNFQEIVNFTFSKLNCALEDYIVRNRKGNPCSREFLNRELHKVFKKYNINVEGGSSHSCRKALGRHYWNQKNRTDESLLMLTEVYGHSSIAMTKKYLGIRAEELASVFLAL